MKFGNIAALGEFESRFNRGIFQRSLPCFRPRHHALNTVGKEEKEENDAGSI
jgi:hypothetical protein